jgi:hypothetical protein
MAYHPFRIIFILNNYWKFISKLSCDLNEKPTICQPNLAFLPKFQRRVHAISQPKASRFNMAYPPFRIIFILNNYWKFISKLSCDLNEKPTAW